MELFSDPIDFIEKGSLQYRVEFESGWQPITEIWVYPGISSGNDGTLTIADEAGTVLLELELNHANPFTWSQHAVPAHSGFLPHRVLMNFSTRSRPSFRSSSE